MYIYIKNVYIDKLPEKKTMPYKSKLVYVRNTSTFLLNLIWKNPNLRLVIKRVSKYKSIFPKGYQPNLINDVIAIKKVKHTYPWIYVIEILKGEEIITHFINKDFKERKKLKFK